MSNLFGDILNVGLQVLDLTAQLGVDLLDAAPASKGAVKGKGKRLARRASADPTGIYTVANVTFVHYPSGSSAAPTGGMYAYNNNDKPSNIMTAQSSGNSASSLLFPLGASGSTADVANVSSGFWEFPSGTLAIAPNGQSSGDTIAAGTELVGGFNSILSYSVAGLALGVSATVVYNSNTSASFQLTLGPSSGTQYTATLTNTNPMTGWQGQISVTDRHGNTASMDWAGGGQTVQTVLLPEGVRLDEGAAAVQLTTEMPESDFQALVAARRSQMRPVDEKTAERVRLAAKRLRA